ncbi:MAG: PCRF domain-containing protein, partial [Firmicutes bacterium]|nr:PCRF domain-containing protein [Bacillota bacterium]
MLEKLAKLEDRYEELNELMGRPEVVSDPEALQRYAREQASMQEIVQKFREYKATAKALADAEA